MLYVGRARASEPFIPGYASDNALQALSYALGYRGKGVVYSIPDGIESQLHSDPDTTYHSLRPEEMAQLPRPGVIYGHGEAIINAPVEPAEIPMDDLPRHIAMGGIGGTEYDMEFATVARGVIEYIEQPCSILSAIVGVFGNPLDYLDPDLDRDVVRVLRECGLWFE